LRLEIEEGLASMKFLDDFGLKHEQEINMLNQEISTQVAARRSLHLEISSLQFSKPRARRSVSGDRATSSSDRRLANTAVSASV
jgi:hypothetical protein